MAEVLRLGHGRRGPPLRLRPVPDGPRQTVAAARNLVRSGRRGAGRAGEVCGTAAWVSCHRPSSLSAAVTLAEDHLVHCPAPPRGEKLEPAPRQKFLPHAAATATARGPSANPPNPSPRWFSQTPGSMTVRPKPQGVPQTSGPECWRRGQLGEWRRSEHLALLDSGAMQTLIQQSLVRPDALVGTPWVSIRCMHGDVQKYPIVPVEIHYQGKKYYIKAAVSSRLLHPLILGTDWKGFNQVTNQSH